MKNEAGMLLCIDRYVTGCFYDIVGEKLSPRLAPLVGQRALRKDEGVGKQRPD
jgi:hypothetical protein